MGARRGIVQLKRALFGGDVEHQHLRGRLWFLLIVAVALDALGTPIAFLLGSDSTFGFWKAASWSTSVLLTGGSSVTAPDKIGIHSTEIVLQFAAVSLIATLAGSFAAFFHRVSQRREEEEGGVRRGE